MQDYTITRLGHLGEGVADGPLFAPLTLPGELISAHRDKDRLTDIRIKTPSADRVTPPCRHFKACGGCQLQHASDSFVAAWKVDVVRTALMAQNIEPVIAQIDTSPAQSRRRATFGARRTKRGALVGFHARGSDVIVEIPDCVLLDPQVLAGRAVASELAVVAGSRKGTLSVTVTASETGLDVHVTGGKPLDRDLRMSLPAVMAKFDLARLSWGDEVVAEARPPYQRFGKALVAPPPGAFLQATRHGESCLLAEVRQAVQGAKSVADLFAGSGTFTLPIAEFSEVSAYESDPQMIAALDRGWRRADGLKRVRAVTRDLFRNPLLPDELNAFDAVVIDPPRAGAKAQVAELAQSRVPLIAFVSCNPVTFARDARTLIDKGYQMQPLRVVDQFRWSSHIEIAGAFVKDR